MTSEAQEAEFYRTRLMRWVAALRSGEYKQTEGLLKEVEVDDGQVLRTIGHCCLGVACELIPGISTTPKTPKLAGEEDEVLGIMQVAMEFDGMEELPPAAFYRWLNLGEYNSDRVWLDVPLDLTVQEPKTPGSQPGKLSTHCELANLNDSGEFTFAMIADCIEYFGVTCKSPRERTEAQGA